MKAIQKYYTMITGSSHGIGKHLALECAARGQNLILVALPGSDLSELKQFIVRRFMVDVKIYEMDLTHLGEPEKLHTWFVDQKIKLNFLINNAGIGYEGKFEELTVAFCEKLMILNTQVVVIMTRLFIPELKKSGFSTILNVSSLASFSPIPYKSMYAASKSFVYYFSRALSGELKNSNIRVRVLCPGPVPTNTDVVKRINKHNFFSRFTTISPQKIAFRCLNSIDNNRNIIIPGIMNKILMLVMMAVPVPFQLKIFSMNSTHS